MVSDDSKHFKKEKASASSPDFFRQDKETERQKQVKEAEKNEKLAKLKTQVQLDTQRKEMEKRQTGHAKEQSEGKMEEKEKTGGAAKFAARERRREEAHQKAIKQGGPEAQTE